MIVGIRLHSPSIKSAPNQAFFVIPRNNRYPYVESLNWTYQRELGYDISFDIEYVATFGRKLQYNQQLNAAPPGAMVPNAPVTVTEIQTGISRKAATNSEALYSIPYLSPGTYRVEIETPGFKGFVRDNVELRVASAEHEPKGQAHGTGPALSKN